MKNWHLLIHAAPLPGSLNMAVDEFLFRSLGGEPRTFLRFYQWLRPTASLGRGQTAAKVVDAEACARNGIDIVRRMTGGKLVLHHREVTYAVISNDVGAFTDTLAGSYKRISQALVKGLEKMELPAVLAGQAPPFYARGTLPCFALPAQDEIEVGGRKIVGSAQKRTAGRFLQHGSIPMAHDEDLLRAISLYGTEGEMRMTSLGVELGRPVEFGWCVERLAAGFEAFFEIGLQPLVLSDAEMERVREIEKAKYGRAEWTFEGRGDSVPS